MAEDDGVTGNETVTTRGSLIVDNIYSKCPTLCLTDPGIEYSNEKTHPVCEDCLILFIYLFTIS